MIVVIAALKGGVGKTTTSVYLAALAAEGRDAAVTVVDADPQASASEWLDGAEDRRLRDVGLVEAPTERLVAKALGGIASEDVAIVDTPPGHERLLSKALAAADVVVVPTRVGGVEPARVEGVLDLIPSGLPAGLAICSAREHTYGHQDTIKEWEDAKVSIWGVIPERVAIAAGPEERLLSWEGMRAYREVWTNAVRASA